MFNADSKIVIFYKITFFLTRLIIYLWHVVETNNNKSLFLTLISILLTFEFNAIQVASNWHFFISVIQWRLYATFSQSFEIFLKNNFQNSNHSNRKDKLANIRIYQCCDISDQIDGYAKILGRMCQISSEINDNFGILITAVIACNYLNITTDSYYMYFIYMSQQQIHLENLTVFTRKYIMVFAELIATILTIFVSNSTMYHARKLESDIGAYTSLQKLDERLEETINTFSMQLTLQQLDINACGLFTLDNQLCFAMISSIVSHLVVLIQFHKTT
ncbi:gustatory receptor for bitter taste 66a-like isoform X1 [Hermetia illucens]|uniref:gustatory receptor for bitter taste 66a-like isoform X1 n=1 Tax=Hermetia illucens TaxID=343691 RepID=UPI0018CC66FD|nr:gustatory receptor for bitter taste 66a-like isoform X1 [Hermetia illucens]